MDRKQIIELFHDLPDKTYAALLAHGDKEEYDFARYFIHTHTDMGSPKDAVLTISKYVETAMYMGAKAISITDHGTMYAVPRLFEKCQDAGIKLLIGCEFYVCDDVEDTDKKKHTRLHLCAYAKDMDGYYTLCRMVTESNTRILPIATYDADTNKKTTLDYPCISRKILEDYLAPGTSGHGHVVLTSACIGGVLTGIAFANDNNKVNLEILDKKIAECNDLLCAQQRILAVQPELTNKKELYQASLKKMDNPEDIQKTTKLANDMDKMLKQAKSELKRIQKKMDDLSKITACSASLFEKHINQLQSEKNQIIGEIIPESNLAQYFEDQALWYDHLAGHGNWFIEIQYHGIPDEKKYMPYLADIADKLGIPTVAANDAHMQKRTDLEARKVVNALRFNKYEEPQIGDEELYLKSDIELFQSLSKCIRREQVWKAMKGRETLAAMCNVELKKEPHYPKYIV